MMRGSVSFGGDDVGKAVNSKDLVHTDRPYDIAAWVKTARELRLLGWILRSVQSGIRTWADV